MIENVQAVLLAVLKFIRVELKARIGKFLEDVVLVSLRERTYTSFSAGQQGRAAERWLGKSRAKLEKALHQRMADSFTRQPDKKKKEDEVSADELKLLDDDSLSVLMLRARLVSSVMDKARESIVALEVRLEALKQAGAQINSKAFTPGAIADGLMDTLKQLVVPPEVELVLMEAYSERGAEMLVAFYQDLNELLISHKVLPDYKYTAPKNPHSKPRPAAPQGWAGGLQPGGAMPPGGGGPGGPLPAARTDATKAGMDMAPPWPAVAAGATLPADFAQLLDAKLSSMQQALAHLTSESWQSGTLRDTFSLPPPISLSPEQEESIDHIEAVFLDLIRDTRISERFRTELNRLILPLMSLRLSDAELFRDPENPVRRFIRQLALLGFRDKELPVQEFEHISLVVGRIVSERAQEVASFKSGADALYTIARNEVRRQLEARQKPPASSVDAEQKSAVTEQMVLQSKRFVQGLLQSMSAGLHLPTIVQHFVLRLLGPWMMLQYQRHGEESEEMRDCIIFASTFFDLLEPAIDEETQRQKILLRQKSIEQMAFEAVRSRTEEKEMLVLLEGMAAFFDELYEDPGIGLQRIENSDSASYVSYLDDLPTVRASE